MKKVILISGKAENGKSEAAKIMEDILSNGFMLNVVRIPFAKYLKMYLKDYWGWDGKEKTDYWRQMHQVIGTEVIRENLKMPAFHAERICQDIQILSEWYDVVIIDDCRFKNELHYTYSKFPHITTDVRIIREGHKSRLTEEQLNHPSECDLDDHNFTHVIKNDGGEGLRREIIDFLRKENLIGGK